MKKHVKLWLASALLSTATAYAVAENTTPAVQPSGETADFSVTLLGTGSVIPRPDRFGASTLVQAGNVNLLFDVGRGSFQRLWQTGLSRNDIDAVFLTHMHSDHTVGLPDLYLSGGTIDTVAKGLPPRPFLIYGPGSTEHTVGTNELMNNIKQGYSADSYIRGLEQKQPTKILDIEAHDVKPGVIYEKNGVKVTAFSVDHGESKPAFGYRVDYDDRSVVISGDTNYKPDEPLLSVANGADVIIHEVLVLGPNFQKKLPTIAKSIADKHTSPSEVGKIFAQLQPKLGVYNHIEWVYDKSDNDKNVIADIAEETKNTYKGPLLIGNDLDKIIINKKGVSVSKPTYGSLPLAQR